MFASKDTLLTRPSGYNIARSVRLRSSASAYLNRTPASAGNQQIHTFSGWVKYSTSSSDRQIISFGNSLTYQIYFGGSGTVMQVGSQQLGVSNPWAIATTQVFRDPSAWYHIVVAVDTTQATASNRVKVYVNGTQVTSFSTTTYPTQNYNTGANTTTSHSIGRREDAAQYFDGYLTEINWIDGQQLTPSSFGETDSITGVWKPKAYSGTYGTNGFELNFSDNSNNTAATIGKDYSGNGNNWTPNNISVTSGVTYDSMVDSPTVGATSSNYAVMNPIVPTGSNVFGNGNLTITGVATYCNGLSTIALGTGAFYAECTVTTHSAEAWGVYDSTKSAAFNIGAGTAVGCYGIYSGGATLITNGSGGATNSGATPASGDIVQVAWSNGSVWLGKNNTWYDSSFGTTGNPSAGTNATFTGLSTANIFCFVFGNGNAASVLNANFGQRPFSYTPPTGFVALNTYNLPASTITNGAAYMAATTYTGTGASLTVANTVGSASFQPDFVWVKGRSGATDHALYDSVRGVQKQLESNQTGAETTETTGLTAFGSTGFTVGALAQMNTSSATYVGWQWKTGGTSASNTNGSITSTVSVGATQGFSVVTYTGTGANATVGHGLGVAPSMIILKSRVSATNWVVYHANLTSAAYVIQLNLTNAQSSSPTIFNSTAPTSSVFSIGTSSASNDTSMVAYCFAAVAGYSAFGSYTGNGSTDGPFVYLGFRPRWLMIKRSSTASVTYGWQMYDTSRQPANTASSDPNLWADTSAAEGTGNYTFDLLSNGFKLRSSGVNENASGDTYIYAAFAENPFKHSLAR